MHPRFIRFASLCDSFRKRVRSTAWYNYFKQTHSSLPGRTVLHRCNRFQGLPLTKHVFNESCTGEGNASRMFASVERREKGVSETGRSALLASVAWQGSDSTLRRFYNVRIALLPSSSLVKVAHRNQMIPYLTPNCIRCPAVYCAELLASLTCQ